MRNTLLAAVAGIAAAVALSVTPALAQSAGSFAGDFLGPNGVAKIITTQVCSNISNTSCMHNEQANLLTATVKVSGAASKSLMLTGSLEDALYTDTSNNGGGNKSNSTATGSIVVTPVVTGPGCPSAADGGCSVYPNQVTFAKREQSLTANLGSCTVTSSGTYADTDTCTDTDTIDLLLSTMSANSFNFIVPNLQEGVYNVALNVNVTASASSNSVSTGATAKAGIDAGSLGVLTVQTQTPFNSLNFSN